MKRILTLLFLGACFIQAQSQVLFFDDFNSGTLGEFTAVDVDGRTVHPNVAGLCGPTWTPAQQDIIDFDLVSTSWFNPVGQADDWLISPPITVTATGTFLVWEAYSPDAAYRDGYEVRVSTTDAQVASFTDIVLTVPAELTTIQTRAVSLDAYIGQTIHFAFRNNSVDKFLLYLDNILVEVFKTNNAIVRSISMEKYNPISTEVPVTVTVENHGAAPLTSLLFTWTALDTSYTDTITGLNIPTLSSREFIHTVPFVYPAPGEYPISVSVTYPNNADDEDPYDNGGDRKLYGMEEVPAKKVVVEEATGTWCGWCPRGAVNMDAIAAEHGDVAIPIAIHNFDPMVVPEYDGPFSGTVPGYPAGHVDRKALGIDPLDFETALLGFQARVVPVAVEVESDYDPDTRTAVIRGTAHSTIATKLNDLRFNCVITEDNVTGLGDDYAQVNYYSGGGQGAMGGYEALPDPVPAADMVYHFVARAILGGYEGLEGSIPDSVDAGQELTIEFQYQVPVGFDETEMKAIIWIQDDDTGEILNGDITNLAGSVAVPLVPVGKSTVYPNPATDILNLEVDYQTEAEVTMRIYSTHGSLVRDLGTLNLTNGKAFETINIADLHQGLYLLELRHKNSVSALPFTKL